MQEKVQHSAIRNSLIALLGIFSVILVASYLLTSHFFDEIEEGQHLVNVAGRNRTTSQRILIDAQKVAAGNENLKVNLSELITEHSIILKALKDGGTITIVGETVHIPEKANEVILPTLKRVEALWKHYKDTTSIIINEPVYIIQESEDAKKGISTETDLKKLQEIDVEGKKIPNPRVKKALEYLNDKALEMLQLNEQLINTYLDVLDKRRFNADLLVLFLTLVNIVFLVVSYFVIKSAVLRPLQAIAETASEIAEGNIDDEIKYEFNNEVGTIVRALNRMINNLKNATDFIQNIGKGNLDVAYKGISEDTDLEKETLAGALLDMRERMRKVTTTEQERKWATEGLALFVEILRDANKPLEELTYKIILEVVRKVEAAQGGIYILNESDKDDTFVEMVACYAFGKQKFLKKQIRPHEGVLGQVMLEKETIFIDDVPQEYADITSGLGAANPTCVLIIPLKLNDKLLGMMELTSFNVFEEYKIEFLERLANNIASTISNAKVKQETDRLLSEQRSITQQMIKQEEERDLNIKELNATKNEMERNEAVLKAQSFAIGTTLVSAEYDMEARLLQANEPFLKKFKYKIEEIINKQHRTFLDTDYAYSEMYLRFWDELRANKTQIGEFKRIAKDGSEIWLRATYVPIPSQSGEPYKVICLAFDITEEKQVLIDFQGQAESVKRSSVAIEFDLQGYISDANEVSLELLQYEKMDILGRHYNELFGISENDSDDYKILWRQLKGGKYQTGEYEFQGSNGEKIWLQGSFNPIFDLNGNTFKVLMLATNITPRKEAEAQIQEAQKRTKVQQENLTALINNTDERILSIDKDYYVTILNDNVRNVFKQMGRDVQMGTNILDTFPQNRYENFKAPYDKALAGEKVRVEENYIGSKGEEISLLVTYNPIFDEEDNVQGVTVFAKDISEIKNNEQQLLRTQKEMQEQEIILRTLINISDEWVYSIDTKYKLMAFNTLVESNVRNTFDRPVRVGDSVLESFHQAEELDVWKELYERILKGEAVLQTIHATGVSYHVIGKPILDAQNKTTGAAISLKPV